jgi:hypothetical protein
LRIYTIATQAKGDKMKKIIVCLLAFALMMGILSGCGKDKDKDEKVTVDSLLEDAAKNSEDIESFAASVDSDVDLTISAQGVSVDVTGGLDLDFETDMESAHVTGSLVAKTYGVDKDETFEAYLVKDGDEMKTYQYTESEDQWEVSEEDADDASIDSIEIDKLVGLLTDDNSDLTLNDDLDEIEGEDAYLIEGTVSMQFFLDLYNEINEELDSESIDEGTSDYADMLEGMGDIDLDISLWIYKDSKLPAQISMDFSSSLSAMLDEYMNMAGMASTEDSDETTDESAADSEYSISSKACEFTLTFSSYNEVDSIEVPQEVIDEAVEKDADESSDFT